MQSTKISIRFLSHCFLWLIKESMWKFLEMVHALVWLSVSLCMLAKPYSLHCFKKKNVLGWRVMNRQGGCPELRLNSVCFRAELIVSHALFPAQPMHGVKIESGQLATTTPVTPAFVFHILSTSHLPESFCPYIFCFGGPSPSLSKRSDLEFCKPSSANSRENEHCIDMHSATTWDYGLVQGAPKIPIPKTIQMLFFSAQLSKSLY